MNDCLFINGVCNNSEISFNTPQKMLAKIDNIKEIFPQLDLTNKHIYKWYFYHQMCLLKNTHFTNVAWSYIANNEETKAEVIHLANVYKIDKYDETKYNEFR